MTPEQIKKLFREMDPEKAQEIRTAYYEAVCGLDSLREALADVPELADELKISTDAAGIMEESELGVYL